MNISHQEVTIFLLSISVLLFLARFLGEMFNKIKQPSIIGEIFAGILLGPTLLGNIFPEIYAYLFPKTGAVPIAMEGITTLAVVMLLIVSGLEVNLSLIVRQTKTAFLTSSFGMVIPFILGFVPCYYFPHFFGIAPDSDKVLLFALFMGTALSISALPVIARTLMDMNLLKSEMGMIIIASAIVNDLFGWVIFSFILGMMGGKKDGLGFEQQLMWIFGFLAFMFLILRKVIDKALPFIQKTFSYPGSILNFIFILGFLAAALTEFVGIHAIFGAFIAGVIIGDSSHLKEKTREIVHQFVTNIFAPLFFISIGLKVDFVAHFDLPVVLIVLVLAFAGKVIGAGLGARLGGMNLMESLAIGFGMNSRGAMEIILGLLALQAGLIQESVFVALVIMALLTSMLSAPAMGYFLNLSKRKSRLQDILTHKNIFILDTENSDSVLSYLAAKAAKDTGLSHEFILQELLEREKLMPTGIANGLAIPHAKLKIALPIVLLAVLKKPIDFRASDNIPASVVVLILSPGDESELYLNLLAETVTKLGGPERVEAIAACKTTEDIAHLIKRFTS